MTVFIRTQEVISNIPWIEIIHFWHHNTERTTP
jgi:hypothetical protein